MHFIISFWSLYLKKDRKPIHNVIYQSAYCMKLPIKKCSFNTEEDCYMQLSGNVGHI